MKNKNKAVWGARFNTATSKIFEKIGASIDIDKRLYQEDIIGSIMPRQKFLKKLAHQLILIKDYMKKIFWAPLYIPKC